jgi:ATPase family associated with various cellular activities (AAA)
MNNCCLIIESKDFYTLTAVLWYITTQSDPCERAAFVVNARDFRPHVLTLARGQGVCAAAQVKYALEESDAPMSTDTKPDLYRRLVLSGSSFEVLTKFVVSAVQEYTKHLGQIRLQTNGISLFNFDETERAWVLAGDAPLRSLNTVFVPGLSDLLDDIKGFLTCSASEEFRSRGIAAVKVVLLHGPPGSGKSSSVRCLCSELGFGISVFTSHDIQGLVDSMNQLPRKTCLLMEDADCYLDKRDRPGFAALLQKLESGLPLREDGLVVFLTTNNVRNIERAFLRRVDNTLEFFNASPRQAVQLIHSFFPKIRALDVWDEMRRLGSTRAIQMSVIMKFLARCMRQHVEPLKLILERPIEFTSLLELSSETCDTTNMFT